MWKTVRYYLGYSLKAIGTHCSSVWCYCVFYTSMYQLSHKNDTSYVMRKPVSDSYMRTTKVQISLRIPAVWSAPLLFADDTYTC